MATASTTSLAALQALGTSVWLDDISRKMLQTGELKRLIAEDHLQGMTSNPTIFQKAISHGSEYDEDVKLMVGEGDGIDAIYQALTVADIQSALDEFKGVYEKAEGHDGNVSLEVSPYLAHDTEGTIAEAKKLWGLLGRPNAMIKVPGTPEGLPAIEELLFSGINVNVTLLFSVDAYTKVAHTFIKALKRRADAGLPIDRIASVASFFISRIDTEADNRIEAKIKETTDPATKAKLEAALGKVAISNGKNAYAVFQKLFSSAEFAPLRAKGAKPQRVLWASVGTKNKAYPDTLYTAGLIGPETVSTMPRAAFDAFKDHGQAAETLVEGMPEAKRLIDGLAGLGIDIDSITDKLLADGVKLFQDSFDELYAAIKEKQAKILQHTRIGQTSIYSELYSGAIQETLASFEKDGAIERMWAKDATYWKSDPAATKIIDDALGWLVVPDHVKAHAGEIKGFADEVVKAGFKHVVVMGMGGSSLCVEVIRSTNKPVAGFPELLVLDGTSPATIRRIEKAVDPAHTLFVVSSKSGTTTEPSVFYAYFFDKVKKIKGEKAGENFVAITDPGTKMEADAKRDGFRKIFLNPARHRRSLLRPVRLRHGPRRLDGPGHRPSSSTTPRSLPSQLASPSQPIREPRRHPRRRDGCPGQRGSRQGDALQPPADGRRSASGSSRSSPRATGKEGRGIVPIAGEPLGKPEVYTNDRVFVQVRTSDQPAADRRQGVDGALRRRPPGDRPGPRRPRRHRRRVLPLGDRRPPGRQGDRDQPVRPAQRPGEQGQHQGSCSKSSRPRARCPTSRPSPPSRGLTLKADPGNKKKLLDAVGSKTGRDLFVGVLKAHFERVKLHDYVADHPVLRRDSRSGTRRSLKLRRHLRDALKVATTTGYGPRFLHSTGQLHKGGGRQRRLPPDDRRRRRRTCRSPTSPAASPPWSRPRPWAISSRSPRAIAGPSTWSWAPTSTRACPPCTA